MRVSIILAVIISLLAGCSKQQEEVEKIKETKPNAGVSPKPFTTDKNLSASSQAQQLLDYGREVARNKKIDVALKVFRRVLEDYGKEPAVENAMLNMGLLYQFQKKDREKAMAQYKEFLTRFPNSRLLHEFSTYMFDVNGKDGRSKTVDTFLEMYPDGVIAAKALDEKEAMLKKRNKELKSKDVALLHHPVIQQHAENKVGINAYRRIYKSLKGANLYNRLRAFLGQCVSDFPDTSLGLMALGHLGELYTEGLRQDLAIEMYEFVWKSSTGKMADKAKAALRKLYYEKNQVQKILKLSEKPGLEADKGKWASFFRYPPDYPKLENKLQEIESVRKSATSEIDIGKIYKAIAGQSFEEEDYLTALSLYKYAAIEGGDMPIALKDDKAISYVFRKDTIPAGSIKKKAEFWKAFLDEKMNIEDKSKAYEAISQSGCGNPEEAQANYYLALHQKGHGNFEEALNHANKATALAPSSVGIKSFQEELKSLLDEEKKEQSAREAEEKEQKERREKSLAEIERLEKQLPEIQDAATADKMKMKIARLYYVAEKYEVAIEKFEGLYGATSNAEIKQRCLFNIALTYKTKLDNVVKARAYVGRLFAEFPDGFLGDKATRMLKSE